MKSKILVYASSNPALGRKIKRALERALVVLRREKKYILVYLVSDIDMKKLNRIYRGKNRETSVLSFGVSHGFPAPDMPRGFKYLGDIYLSPSFIKREEMDIRRLAVHGLLHLLGYAHGKKHDRMKMKKKEEQLMRYVVNNNRN